MTTPDRPRLALAGGSGSSGTTLLANLLGRHSEIVAAPELDVFNHEEVLSLETLREGCRDLLDQRRLSSGFKLVERFFGPRESLGVTRSIFERWVRQARSVDDFYSSLAAHVCSPRGASVFVEKTPTNVYTFRAFARVHPATPLIHQIRDGRDVAASLMRRGMTLFSAGSRWLYDTSAGLAARGGPAYLETRYEALASEPETVLRSVLAHLGLDYEPTMLEGSPSSYEEDWRSKKSAKQWRSLPSDPVSASSIGTFRAALSSGDLAMLCRIRLTRRAAEDLGAVAISFGELLEHLEYGRDAGASGASIGFAVRSRGWRDAGRDHAMRARRSLRYARRWPVILTTLGG